MSREKNDEVALDVLRDVFELFDDGVDEGFDEQRM